MIDLQKKSPKILVIGDLIIDRYLWGACERISLEAPVPIININNESTVLGGAGNVVNNLCALGAEVDIISVVGNCQTANELKQLLNDINVSTQNIIIQTNRISSKKTRIIASQQQVIRYDKENNDEIDAQSQASIIHLFKQIIIHYDCVLLSDYGKGVLTHQLTQSLITISNQHQKKVLVDPKGINYEKYKNAYLLTPNKKEASQATGISIQNKKSLTSCLKKLKKMCGLTLSLITLSEQGVAILDDDILHTYPTVAKEVFDVTGAGDTILASLGFALSSGLDIDEAVKFSNLAAGVVVSKIGSATATLNEIIEYESSLNNSSSNQHIKTLDEITILSQKLKTNSKKIVFTNGCFDILHTGHVNYLESAKKFGDILIVGLNADNSVARLKGKNRPINIENDRAYILAALKVVDYVVIFTEDTPYNLIKKIKPHVLVKGGDYKGKTVIGQDIVDEIKLVTFVDGKSTTSTIEKIQNNHTEVL